MSKHYTENSLDALLNKIYPYILKHGADIKASKGSCRECRNIVLNLKNPLARFSGNKDRGGVFFSCLGETLWYFSGSDELKFIEYYIRDYRKFIKAGKEISTAGGAYGPRLFGGGILSESQADLFVSKCQVQAVIDMLRAKATTRQAVIQLFDKSDIEKNKDDVPCTCIMQFFSRNNVLDMIVYMRSNDAYKGLPHDVFAFTFLQEYVARSVDNKVGVYSHHVGSLHIYEEDEESVRKFCKEPCRDILSMPPMPQGNPYDGMQWLLEKERVLRFKKKVLRLDDANVASYWQDVARILLFKHLLDKRDMREIIKLKNGMSSAVYENFIRTKIKKIRDSKEADKQLSLNL
ncbi:MAG: thymidylate synthase [Candidatus Tokpelaia sp.]|nr:MAG: thymidylate synthase [Candidatus Tokpelaia sp.]KAA6207379.1 MAG: thymidylate synthase [Candidatus Tokpelaia sp.]